ncbi:MAG: hypothetical protein ACK55K_03195 [Bacteroidota bacterium]
MTTLKFIIDKAPGKDLIPAIIENKSFDDFYAFYKIRVDWHGYPLIHDRMVTYGLFHDLTHSIPEDKETILKFIDFSIRIAENESDKRFLNSLFLILDFCSIAEEFTIPTQHQIDKITSLVYRVKKLSFLPNITTFWEHILDFLVLGKSIKKEDYVVKNDDYLSVMNMDFPTIDDNTVKSCPVSESKLMEEIEGVDGEYEPLQFVRSAMIDTDKYWVWQYKNITGNDWSWYITVKQDDKNKITIERHLMQSGERKTPEKLLLEYHYKG